MCLHRNHVPGMLGPTKLRVCLARLLEGVQQNGGPSLCCWASSFHPLLMSTQISQRWLKESCSFTWIWRTPACYLLHILHRGLLQFDCDSHCTNTTQDRSGSQVHSALASDVIRLLHCWCDQAVPSSELLWIMYWVCQRLETSFASFIWVHFHSRGCLCFLEDMKPAPSD